ncbi:MAG: mechanosensitive ion channel family protein, partial [Gemmatimonadetes bacterium]|nr:mechanosensitive ion channel family protein [Gemmatimonadota bacterium]
LTALTSSSAIRVGLLVALGVPGSLLVSRVASRWVTFRYGAQAGLVVGKLVFYPLVLTVLAGVLLILGVTLAPLLGAAGVLGIALGFASQTSVSNIISGFFLLGEQPFVVGDAIQIGTTTGVVMSVGTLSVQLRTFDNRFVRIPNEVLIKSEVINLTRFPIRRLEVKVGVTRETDSERIRDMLLDLARDTPRVLVHPAPQTWFDGFGESSLDLRLTVWTETDRFWEVKNDIHHRLKARLDAEGIAVALPHRVLVSLPLDPREPPTDPPAPAGDGVA